MKQLSEVIHEAVVQVKKDRDELEPHTFDFLLATDVMKELADLEFRTFNQELRGHPYEALR